MTEAATALKQDPVPTDTRTPASDVPTPPEFDTNTPAFKEVTALNGADIRAWTPWLFARFRERFPVTQDRTFSSWLAGWMNDNNCVVYKTGKACGLATILFLPMSPHPVLYEVFMFTHGGKGSHIQAEKIYKEFLRWGKMFGAHEFLVWHWSDVPNEHLKTMLGAVGREQLVVRMVK